MCYHPLYLKDRDICVPCGQCIGCRLERSRQWAVRCMHEASLHEGNAFVTLTYSDEFLPHRGSLRLSDLQDFWKRFRRRIEPRKIRYFACGEYGAVTKRPHYHGCIFGFGFPDKSLWSMRGSHQVFRSGLLEDLWPFGMSEVGSVSFESAAYVARYVLKKVTGRAAPDYYTSVDDDTGECFAVEPEFGTMSRRPGIGRGWYDKYHCEVYPADSVVVRGRLAKPPRYYDGLYALEPRNQLAVLKEKRRELAKVRTLKELERTERASEITLQGMERGL